MPLSGTANGAGTAADGTEGTVRTPGIAAAAAAAAAALSGRDAAAFSSFLRVLNLPPAAAREAPAQVRPLGGPGGSRAAPGGPAPAGWWVGGMSVPMGAAAAAAGSRGALPLALVRPRSVSRKDIVGTRSYLGCNVVVEYGSDLGYLVSDTR